jgi:hypothetical protein
VATLYDKIGRTYSGRREADPRIGAAIALALDGCASILNVGKDWLTLRSLEVLVGLQAGGQPVGVSSIFKPGPLAVSQKRCDDQ